MIKILLNGCNGRIGQTITALAEKNEDIVIAAGINRSDNIKNPYPVFTNIFECSQDFDVIIDFSTATALDDLLTFALYKKKPVLIATTGHTEDQKNKITEASKQIPVFFCANTSLGVNLLLDLVKKAASVLSDSFDIEIVEKHHNQKVDAPSGTALVIANVINETIENKYDYVYDRHTERKKRSNKEIGLHAIRGGTYVGEHTVIFAGNDEVLEIKHSALSKNVFAEGAVKAAKFLADKPAGFYTMKDMLKG